MTGGADEYGSLDALDLISHETRVAILRGLVEASLENPIRPAVSFTDLRDAAGVDDTGRFNYHLNQLRDRYVVETDEGYQLSAFGRRVVGPMLAGAYDTGSAPDPIPVEADCPACDSPFELRYVDGTFDLVCENDHALLQGLSMYPGIVEGRSVEEARRVLAMLTRQSVELVVNEVCPVCYARAEMGISGDVVTYAGDHLYLGQCTTCGNKPVLSVECCAIVDPRIVEFFVTRGLDLWSTPLWRVESFLPGGEEVLGADPLRLRVDIAYEGDHVGVVLDRDGSVVAVEE